MCFVADRTVLRIDTSGTERRAPAGPAVAHEAGSTVVALIDPTYDRLTTDNACLLLIDHQIGPLWELEFADTRHRVVELATAARRFHLPTIISAIGIENLGPIIPELTAAFEEAPHIVRSAVNAWDDPRVRSVIEETGRKKLIVAGSVANVGVALCAKSAVDAGYDVYAPIDASAQFSHAASSWLSRAGVIVTTVSLLTREIEGAHARRKRVGQAGRG
jgi:nicotinamidase-related amidase